LIPRPIPRCYTAAGDISALLFHNGVTETHSWNSLFEHTGISADGATGNLMALGYAYCADGSQQCATGNTGSPWQHTISVGGQPMAVQQYLHDSLNRHRSVRAQVPSRPHARIPEVSGAGSSATITRPTARW
jgi:hypothetical protein